MYDGDDDDVNKDKDNNDHNDDDDEDNYNEADYEDGGCNGINVLYNNNQYC